MDTTTESNADNEDAILEAAGWIEEENQRIARLDREARKLAKRFGFALRHRHLPTTSNTLGHYDLIGPKVGWEWRGMSLDGAIAVMTDAAKRRGRS